jgi:hypothetical protein
MIRSWAPNRSTTLGSDVGRAPLGRASPPIHTSVSFRQGQGALGKPSATDGALNEPSDMLVSCRRIAKALRFETYQESVSIRLDPNNSCSTRVMRSRQCRHQNHEGDRVAIEPTQQHGAERAPTWEGSGIMVECTPHHNAQTQRPHVPHLNPRKSPQIARYLSESRNAGSHRAAWWGWNDSNLQPDHYERSIAPALSR